MAKSYLKGGFLRRETLIVFVYDTECCTEETDDPIDAVLYFHPSWVSDVQKMSLCGQLMGTTRLLTELFSKPKVIALQSGKFFLREFGRFILAVGTDRNIMESVLEHRAELLTSLLQFYHRDIQTIYEQFSSSGQYKNLTEKLYHIFETYLPILQHNGSCFQNVPTLRLPKTASNIFLNAMQTLQSCQQTKGILGGTILYHNKVLATQLSATITKNLVLTDPFRIKSTAEPVKVGFLIPAGVTLLVVYIPTNDYKKLLSVSQKAQSVVLNNFSTQSLPFHYPKRKIKRDKSLLFTNIPEEGTEANTTESLTNESKASRPKILSRPNYLPLRFKNVTSDENPESGFTSINFDENDSYPEFIGRTSVCSTPMTENKILHGNIMSICANPTENLIVQKKVEVIDGSLQETGKRMSKTPTDSKKVDFETIFSNFATNPYKMERRNSFSDLQDSLKRISKRLTLRTFGIGLSKLDVSRDGSTSPDYVDDIESKKTRSITDPTYPVFNDEGDPMSRSLFQEFVDRHYNSWNPETLNEENVCILSEEFKEFHEASEIKEKINKDASVQEAVEVTEKITANMKPQNRKSLSLPLKPLSETGLVKGSLSAGIFDGKKSSGIQLTPLMAKLSVLPSNEERSSGFCSWDTTPGGEITTPINGSKGFRRRSSVKLEDTINTIDEGFTKTELYVCGQQNMTLLLLMEAGSGQSQELVQAMFDTSISRLSRIETHLNQTLNVNIDGDKSEGGYSYICVDPEWDTLQRGGPWSPEDLMALEHMHQDFSSYDPITDIILRAEDSVLYSYKCGPTEVFYKQSAQHQSGIPPPADTMGTISLRAKRRLERDHSFILF